jgi:N-methylhydantoinase A
VTDAQVVLGRIVAREMSGGVSLDVSGARAAVAALAKRLGSDVERTARAILAIADAEMARALRRVSVDRGVDPRQCSLIAFGGGGPLHACALADALAMPSIIVPPFAGVLSAVGLALAPERRETAMSLLTPTSSLTRERLDAAVRSLTVARDHPWSKTAEHRDADSPPSEAQRTFARMRYRGQGHELEIPVQPGDDGAALATRFTASHGVRYGFTLPADAEVVAMRHEAGEPARGVRFERDDAPSPETGPATLQLPDATMFVAEGWRATPLPIGGWRLERT